MEFRLTYKGALPAEGRSGGRTKEKQILRKEFHKQLAELWNQHAALTRMRTDPLVKSKGREFDYANNCLGPEVTEIVRDPRHAKARPWIEHLAEEYSRCGYRFVPLVRKDAGFTCSLDILFMRRDGPGNLIHSGGDIDNRVKVLFDGLKMPSSLSELAGYTPEAHEDPFFCLLEDDSLITSVSVTTDRLLIPIESNERVNDVFLVIHVRVADPDVIFSGDRLI